MPSKPAAPSIFKSPQGEAALREWYDRARRGLPVATSSRFVPSDAGPTHVLIAGPEEAAPLVVLHGMNMNAPAMGAALGELSGPRRVFAIDTIGMPGLSAGTRPSRKGDGYLVWLEQVLDGLGLARADFLGMSFGGWLILRLAARSPQRMTKAVLLDAGGLTNFTLRGQVIAGFASLRYARWPTDANRKRAASDLFFGAGREPDPDLVELFALGLRHVRLDLDLGGVPPATRGALAGLEAPVLVLYGEQDLFFDAHRSIARAKRVIPNLAAAEVLPGEGHVVSRGAVPEVYSRIRAFLG